MSLRLSRLRKSIFTINFHKYCPCVSFTCQNSSSGYIYSIENTVYLTGDRFVERDEYLVK